MNLLNKFITKYSEILLEYPLLTSSVTTSTLAGVGDYMSQTLVEGKSKWDTKRTS